MPVPEPLSRHACETATSLFSVMSALSAQPGSSRSVWPSSSSSSPFAHAFAPPPPGGGVGVTRGLGASIRPPLLGAGAGVADGAGGAGGAPRPSRASSAAASAGMAFPHSLAASTPARPLVSSAPFRRLASSLSSPEQLGALPPSSAAATVLNPLTRPVSVTATFAVAVAAAPRGRTMAIASLPPLTPPATVTPAGADFTFTAFTSDAKATATCPSAGGASDLVAACAAELDISRTPRVTRRTRSAGSMPATLRSGPEAHIGDPPSPLR